MPSDPAETRSRAVIAGNFEDEAGLLVAQVEGLSPNDDAVERLLGIAQVKATIALGQRVAALTDDLGDYLGDDGKLQRIEGVIKDGLAGIEDRLSDVRQGVN